MAALAIHERLLAAAGPALVREGLMTAQDLPDLREYFYAARRACEPATSDEALTHLVALSLHYYQPVMTEEANAQRWGDWLADMKGVPEDILAAACRDWRRSKAKNFPSPGQLMERCVSVKMRMALRDRARTVIEAFEQTP